MNFRLGCKVVSIVLEAVDCASSGMGSTGRARRGEKWDVAEGEAWLDLDCSARRVCAEGRATAAGSETLP